MRVSPHKLFINEAGKSNLCLHYDISRCGEATINSKHSIDASDASAPESTLKNERTEGDYRSLMEEVTQRQYLALGCISTITGFFPGSAEFGLVQTDFNLRMLCFV